MNIKPKKIEFVPNSEDLHLYSEPPTLAKNTLPDWYKDSPSPNYKSSVFGEHGEKLNVSIKMCIPFLDSITAGYIQKSWTDIHISMENGQIKYSYASQPQILALRDNIHTPPMGFYQYEFVWKMYWMAKVPKGYSVMITHPLNRNDLPFQTLSGVLDSDDFFSLGDYGGDLPFYIKEGFSGIIPKGTPIYQIIPFKRDKWNSKVAKYDKEVQVVQDSKIRSKFWGGYKNEFWKKKEWG